MKTTLHFLPVLIFLQPCLAGIITVNSDLTISPNDSYEGIDVIDDPPNRTTVTVLGGTINSLRILDSALANIYGGSIFGLSAGDYGTLNVFGLDYSAAIGVGGSAQINLYGDAHQSVYAVEASSVKMYPGSVAADLVIRNSASGAIYGGLVNGVVGIHDTGNLILTGGQIGEFLIADGDSTVEIYGSGFTYDPSGGQLGMGLVQGFWLDGTPLSISLAPGTGDTYSHLIFLPEPSSLMLLALGGLAVIRRRQ